MKPHGGSRSARVWSCDLLRVGKGLNRPSAFSPLAAKKQHVVSAPGQEQSPPTNSQSSDSRGNLRAFALSRHRWGPRQGRDSPHYGGTVGKLRIGPKYPIQRLYVPCGAALKALRAGRTLRVLLLLIVQCSGCDRYLRLRDRERRVALILVPQSCPSRCSQGNGDRASPCELRGVMSGARRRHDR